MRQRFGRCDALAWTGAVLLHVLAAGTLLRWADGGRHVTDAVPRHAFTVMLLPPPPAPEPEPEPVLPPARASVAAPSPTRREPVPRRVPQPIAVAPADTRAPAPAPDSENDAPAAGTPRFDRGAALETAREFAAELQPRPGAPGERQLTTDEKLGQAIDRSRKTDCRTAYAGAGILAALYLARDAVTDKGCKW